MGQQLEDQLWLGPARAEGVGVERVAGGAGGGAPGGQQQWREGQGRHHHHHAYHPTRHGSQHDAGGRDLPPAPTGAVPVAAAAAAAAATLADIGSPLAAGLPPAPPPPPHYTDAELLPVVGLDCEWRPFASTSQPSLVQLSTDTDVWLVDLLALAPWPQALAAALRPAIGARHVFKVGVGIRFDLGKLAAAQPGAFGAARSCLDLAALWQAHVTAGGAGG